MSPTMARGARTTSSATSSAAQTGHRFPWHIHSTSSSSQNRCSQAVCTGASSTPWQMEQSRCRLTLLPSTKQLSSRPMAAAAAARFVGLQCTLNMA